ncbi:hypothetical protein [Pontixanthobacter sp. CEM42]|uniref:hypothetical protein n=1 Tax=Pontixanthobacter sp. CEM42 TaxID=2792077 RepID=UPI001ADF96FF|nr:hypothetical protein [Pontixanthobacter sp. CEM42]
MGIRTILYAICGLASFLIGAYNASAGERTLGIALMGIGLLFQVLALRGIRAARHQSSPGDM